MKMEKREKKVLRVVMASAIDTRDNMVGVPYLKITKETRLQSLGFTGFRIGAFLNRIDGELGVPLTPEDVQPIGPRSQLATLAKRIAVAWERWEMLQERNQKKLIVDLDEIFSDEGTLYFPDEKKGIDLEKFR